MATSAEFRATQARIRKSLKKWRPVFQLDGWSITAAFHNGPFPESPGAAACVITQWQYRDATIHFDCQQMAMCSDEELEDTVVHELTHIPLAEMSDYHTDEHYEHTTTVMSRIIQAAARG